MHGFITRDGTPPAELLAIARKELERYPSVKIEQLHVSRARKEGDEFIVSADEGAEYRAKTVVLATGLHDALPQITGLPQRWGKGVFVCPYCDAWEMRGRRIAVLGKNARAVELAQELHQWTDDLVVCFEEAPQLDEKHRRWLQAAGAHVHDTPLVSVGGEAPHLTLGFSGSQDTCSALFLCAPLRQRYPLVAMLGCSLDEDGAVRIDEHGRTVADGVYAAGDAVTSVHQVVLAAASGVCAAMAVNEDLLNMDIALLSEKKCT